MQYRNQKAIPVASRSSLASNLESRARSLAGRAVYSTGGVIPGLASWVMANATLSGASPQLVSPSRCGIVGGFRIVGGRQPIAWQEPVRPNDIL